VRRDLEGYCGLDARGMSQILSALRSLL